MTKEEIISGNKLIAQFMGAKFFKPLSGTENFKFYDDIGDVLKTGNLRELKYSSDWNSLMSVVEKIDGLHTIESEELNIENLTIFADIKMVYKAVIHYINWYNKSKK